MDNDDYEILPHQLLADLKSEVEGLKKKLTQPDAKANELMLEMESLKDSLNELTTIFQKALEDVKQEGDVSVQMKNLNNRIDNVVSQNEIIAKGMIAISDKLEDFIAKQKQASLMSPPIISQPSMNTPSVQHTMGMPMMDSNMPRMAPMPSMELPPLQMQPSNDLDFPPPPPGFGARKRGGLFK